MAYDLSEKTAPALYPVSLHELKRHLGIETDHDDSTLVNATIPAATAAVQLRTHRQLLEATLMLTVPDFPLGSNGLYLPAGQFQSVSAIRWYDEDENETELTLPDDILIRGSSDYPVLYAASPYAWPHAHRVEVDYVAGYGTGRRDVPALLRQAVLVYAGYLYDDRAAEEPPKYWAELCDMFALGNEFTLSDCGYAN